MLQKTRGIVLHTLKYNDTSLIVDIYTEQYGCVSFLLTVSKSKHARVKSQLFCPLALLEIEYDFRPKANLQRIKEARNYYPFSTLPYNPVKTAIGIFLAEFLHRALRNELANLPLYAYLTSSIEWFDCSQTDYSNFHLVFLLRLSRFLGFFPNVEEYCVGDYFDLQHSRFVSLPPTHSAFLLPEDAVHLSGLLRMNYDTMHLFSLSGNQRFRCLEVLNDYYRLHLPDFPLLKSLEVLRDVFR